MVIKPYALSQDEIDFLIFNFILSFKCRHDGCWIWTGREHNGYGVFSTKGGSKWAHRVSYAMFVGPIEAQMHIDHTCRNRLCVNPYHLKKVTPVENYEAIHRRKRRDIRAAQEAAGQTTIFNILS